MTDGFDPSRHDPSLRPEEVAKYLGYSQSTLAQWRCAQQGPVYYKVGGRVRYRLSALNTWVDQQQEQIAAAPRERSGAPEEQSS
jgi:excisionase family DNA binding protein